MSFYDSDGFSVIGVLNMDFKRPGTVCETSLFGRPLFGSCCACCRAGHRISAWVGAVGLCGHGTVGNSRRRMSLFTFLQRPSGFVG